MLGTVLDEFAVGCSVTMLYVHGVTQEAFSGKPIDGPRVPIEGKGEKRLSANAELLDLPHLFLFETQ